MAKLLHTASRMHSQADEWPFVLSFAFLKDEFMLRLVLCFLFFVSLSVPLPHTVGARLDGTIYEYLFGLKCSRSVLVDRTGGDRYNISMRETILKGFLSCLRVPSVVIFRALY